MRDDIHRPDQRAEPRSSVNIPARLFYGEGYRQWAECVIKDRSASGAKVQVPALFTLPAKMILLQLNVGAAYDAMLRWRKADLAGLSLVGSHDLNTGVEPRMEAIRATYLLLRG